jgi:hypothetical protein
MEREEFKLHLNILNEILQRKNTRVIIVHNPYTPIQQKIIDSICMKSFKIIGQVERINPEMAALEIDRLLSSHHEPFVDNEKLEYVILGQQKPKNAFNIP